MANKESCCEKPVDRKARKGKNGAWYFLGHGQWCGSKNKERTCLSFYNFLPVNAHRKLRGNEGWHHIGLSTQSGLRAILPKLT